MIAGELLRKLLVDYSQYLLSLGDPCFRMNNERFMVPELLFNPSDIGEFFSFASSLFKVTELTSTLLIFSCCTVDMQN
jgi:hypothetical protein